MLLSIILLGAEIIIVIVMVAVFMKFLSKIMAKNMPEDIKEAILARPNDPRGITIVGYIFAFILFICLISLYIWAGIDAKTKNMEMMQIFLRYVLLLDGYKLFDMICLDWWLITKSGIYQRLYPETIGCKSYEKMGYNTKS